MVTIISAKSKCTPLSQQVSISYKKCSHLATNCNPRKHLSLLLKVTRCYYVILTVHFSRVTDFFIETMPIWPLPFGESYLVWTKFIVGWPIRLLYKVTIPDCKLPTVRKWFPVTLLMCIVWNTILCYLLGWMVTVIGW